MTRADLEKLRLAKILAEQIYHANKPENSIEGDLAEKKLQQASIEAESTYDDALTIYLKENNHHDQTTH